MKKFLIGALVAGGLAVGSQAQAATYLLTDDHCSGTCGGLASYGTITVSGTTNLDIKIDLTSGVTFNSNGAGLDTVSFDLVGNPLVTISGLPATWGVNANQTAGSNHEDGFGSFDYVVNENSGFLSSIEFHVVGAGANAGQTLVQDHNVADSKNIYFAVDVVGTNGKTGVIGATLAPAGVPEPATWAMMLVGFGGMGALMRRKRRVSAAAVA
jgi:hypothetical protein